ncbi:Cyclin-K [Fasciola gigantica]|uniref:Cyclin-K n=1 Tax=Fasciola gigantica TaxID=46835 RepID=A0A504YHA4_FASGI|nr:Cyclin-K [Fasciola gigantica]
MEDQQQMPCWYYDREDLIHTPSFHDQIDTETETRYRREGARFLFDVSNKLKLRYDTCATAIVFFHRFYMSHSFKAFPRYVTASCCLMLAGKVEETPKKVRDIIKTAKSLLSDADFKQFGTDPKVMEDICHKILDLYPAGAPAETAGPSTTSAPRNPNPVPPSSGSSSIRNHPSFNTAASAANTVGTGPLPKRPRIGSTNDMTHIQSLPPTHGVPALQPSLSHMGSVAARNIRRGA